MIFLPCCFIEQPDNGLIGGLIFLEAAQNVASFFRACTKCRFFFYLSEAAPAEAPES